MVRGSTTRPVTGGWTTRATEPLDTDEIGRLLGDAYHAHRDRDHHLTDARCTGSTGRPAPRSRSRCGDMSAGPGGLPSSGPASHRHPPAYHKQS